MSEPKEVPVYKRKGAWVATVVAVSWAFLGVRRHAEYQSDIKKLNPLHIAVVGLVATILFVLGLMVFVRWVVAVS